MASTSTIYAETDSGIRQSDPTTNYGSNTLLRIGYYSGSNKRHAVLKFDVSSITNPTDIVSCNFTLTEQNTFGTTTRTMKVSRLNQTFVENEVTWEISETGTDWSGGDGAAGNAETTQTTYSISVGNSVGDQTVDIKELVIDAINKRSGILWLVIYIDPDDSSTDIGNSVFYSSETGTASNRPQIEVVVADRISWDGETSTLVTTARNWVGGVAPTANDYALFINTPTFSPTSGLLQVSRVYVGKNFKGNIGTGGIPLSIECDEFHNASRYALVNANINESASDRCELRVKDTSTDTIKFDGKYSAIINRTRSDVTLVCDDVNEINAMGRAVTFNTTGELPTTRIVGGTATLAEGGGTLTAVNGASVVSKRVSEDDTNYYVSSSKVRILADEYDAVYIYSGLVFLKGNTGAPIGHGGALYIYPSGTFDARTNSATWNPSAVVSIFGGRLITDAGVNAAPA